MFTIPFTNYNCTHVFVVFYPLVVRRARPRIIICKDHTIKKMGKPRRKTGRSGVKGKEDVLRRLNSEVDGLAIGDGKRKKKREKPPLTAQACLDKAKEALDAYNIDEAFRLCAYALESDAVSI